MYVKNIIRSIFMFVVCFVVCFYLETNVAYAETLNVTINTYLDGQPVDVVLSSLNRSNWNFSDYSTVGGTVDIHDWELGVEYDLTVNGYNKSEYLFYKFDEVGSYVIDLYLSVGDIHPINISIVNSNWDVLDYTGQFLVDYSDEQYEDFYFDIVNGVAVVDIITNTLITIRDVNNLLFFENDTWSFTTQSYGISLKVLDDGVEPTPTPIPTPIPNDNDTGIDTIKSENMFYIIIFLLGVICILCYSKKR